MKHFGKSFQRLCFLIFQWLLREANPPNKLMSEKLFCLPRLSIEGIYRPCGGGPSLPDVPEDPHNTGRKRNGNIKWEIILLMLGKHRDHMKHSHFRSNCALQHWKYQSETKGRLPLPKRMNFRKSSKRGGEGSFSIQKFILQNLDL